MSEIVIELRIISLGMYASLVAKKIRPKILYCDHVWWFDSLYALIWGKHISSIIFETRGNGLLPNNQSNLLQSNYLDHVDTPHYPYCYTNHYECMVFDYI